MLRITILETLELRNAPATPYGAKGVSLSTGLTAWGKGESIVSSFSNHCPNIIGNTTIKDNFVYQTAKSGELDFLVLSLALRP